MRVDWLVSRSRRVFMPSLKWQPASRWSILLRTKHQLFKKPKTYFGIPMFLCHQPSLHQTLLCVCVLCINCDSIKLITIPPSSLLPPKHPSLKTQTHTIWWCFPYIWASSSEKLWWKALFTTFFFRNLFRENHEWKTETVGDLCSCSAARSMSRARLWTPTTLRTLQQTQEPFLKLLPTSDKGVLVSFKQWEKLQQAKSEIIDGWKLLLGIFGVSRRITLWPPP